MSDLYKSDCTNQEVVESTITAGQTSKAVVYSEVYNYIPNVAICDVDNEITVSNQSITGCDITALDTNGRAFKLLIYC